MPIRCIILFAQKVLQQISDLETKKNVSLILSTAKVLRAKVQTPLDQNLIEKGFFEPRLREAALVRTVRETVDIMQSQAKLSKSKLSLVCQTKEKALVFDDVRV
jgi:hypothetical protein